MNLEQELPSISGEPQISKGDEKILQSAQRIQEDSDRIIKEAVNQAKTFKEFTNKITEQDLELKTSAETNSLLVQQLKKDNEHVKSLQKELESQTTALTEANQKLQIVCQDLGECKFRLERSKGIEQALTLQLDMKNRELERSQKDFNAQLAVKEQNIQAMKTMHAVSLS